MRALPSNCIENVKSAHDIHCHRFQWLLVGKSYQWLCGEMKDEVGTTFPHCPGYSIQVAYVDKMLLLKGAVRQQGVDGRRSVRGKGDSTNRGTKFAQPEGKPGSFEPGMTGDQHSPTLIDFFDHHAIQKSEHR